MYNNIFINQYEPRLIQSVKNVVVVVENKLLYMSGVR